MLQDIAKSFSEQQSPSVSPDDLKNLTSKLVSGPSLLDGITEPVDLEQVKHKIFQQFLQPLAILADGLGYGWVSGVNGKLVGDDYIWVPTDNQGGSTYHQFTGPGFAPNMNGTASGYMWDKRCSIEFTDVHFTFSDPTFSNPRWLDSTIEVLNTFEVDNTDGITPVTSQFSIEFWKQGQAGAATQKNWQHGWNFSIGSTQTFNAGGGEGMFFPSFSFSLTEQAGMSGSTGGSQSYTTEMTQGQRQTSSNSVQTPAYTKAKYLAQVNSGKGAIDFQVSVTLSFGVRFYGFLRWGGGKPLQGNTNYHRDYSGNGNRPTVPYTFGGKDEPFWVALQRQSSTEGAPWAWNELFASRPDIKHVVDSLCTTAAGLCTFPVYGVMAGIQRSDFHFKAQLEPGGPTSVGPTDMQPTPAASSSETTPSVDHQAQPVSGSSANTSSADTATQPSVTAPADTSPTNVQEQPQADSSNAPSSADTATQPSTAAPADATSTDTQEQPQADSSSAPPSADT